MRFLVSQVQIAPQWLVLIGFAVGTLGGFFGVGGSFLAGPALYLLGLPMNYVVGTDVAHIVGKSVVAAKKHRALGNVDIKLGLVMAFGTIPGVELGARLVQRLKATKHADLALGLSFSIVLLAISVFILWESLGAMRQKKIGTHGKNSHPLEEGRSSPLQLRLEMDPSRPRSPDDPASDFRDRGFSLGDPRRRSRGGLLFRFSRRGSRLYPDADVRLHPRRSDARRDRDGSLRDHPFGRIRHGLARAEGERRHPDRSHHAHRRGARRPDRRAGDGTFPRTQDPPRVRAAAASGSLRFSSSSSTGEDSCERRFPVEDPAARRRKARLEIGRRARGAARGSDAGFGHGPVGRRVRDFPLRARGGARGRRLGARARRRSRRDGPSRGRNVPRRRGRSPREGRIRPDRPRRFVAVEPRWRTAVAAPLAARSRASRLPSCSCRRGRRRR